MDYIDLHNDYVAPTRPIVGTNPTTLRRELYHSTDVVAFITDTPGSNTPIGGLSTACPEVGTTARYAIVFQAAVVDLALGGLDDGAVVYRVLTGPGDLRVEDPLTLRHIRPSDEP